MLRVVPRFASVCIGLACATEFQFAAAQLQVDWVANDLGHQSLGGTEYACIVNAAGESYAVGGSDAPFFVGQQADALITKRDAAGSVLWSRTVDLFEDEDTYTAIAFDLQGGVSVTGYSTHNSETSLIVASYTSSGALAWLRRLDGQGASNDSGNTIVTGANGQIFIGGRRQFPIGQMMVASYSPTGQLLWATDVPSGLACGNSGVARKLALTPAGNLVAVGTSTYTSCQGNFTVAKLDVAGTPLWTRHIDGTTGTTGEGVQVVVLDENVAIVAGHIGAGSLVRDLCIVAIDLATGAPLWTRLFDGPTGGQQTLVALERGPDGTLWVAAHSPRFTSDLDWLCLRYDTSGNLLSTAWWDSGMFDQVLGLSVDSAGGARVFGRAGSNAACGRLDASGAFVSNQLLNYPGLATAWIRAVTAAPNDRVMLVGNEYSPLINDGAILTAQLDFSDAPSGYCSAQANSLGCTPSIEFTGLSSVASTSGFAITTTNVRNRKPGVLIYGVNGAAATPFQGGQLCVASPLRRTPTSNSAGSVSGDDCSGAFALDMNAFAHGALGGTPAPELLVAGTAVYCQQVSRDPGAPFNANLSSGLRYTVLP